MVLIRVRNIRRKHLEIIFKYCDEYKFHSGREQYEYFGNRYTCIRDQEGNSIGSQELLQFSGSNSELSLKCRGKFVLSNIGCGHRVLSEFFFYLAR